MSRHSSQSSSNRQYAAAVAAANEAKLQVLLEKEQHIEELEKLEAEDSERKKVLEAKRRQIEQMDTIKKLKAAKARLQVYEQNEGSDEEIDALLHQHVPLKEVKQESNLSKSHPQPQAMPLLNHEDTTEALMKVFADSIVFLYLNHQRSTAIHSGSTNGRFHLRR
jgi:hypothetical protein